MIGEEIALAFAAAGSLVWYWLRRDWFAFALGVGFLLAAAIVFIRFGPRGGVIAGPVSGSVTLAAVLLGCLAWLEALGRPRRLATFLGLGLWSRVLVFNNRLIETYRPFMEAVNGYQVDAGRRTEALAVAERQVRRFKSIRAPDPDWATMGDDIADQVAKTATLLRSDAPLERYVDLRQEFAPVFERWIRMGEDAALAQRSLATPARRRRREVVWLLTTGISALLIGLAEARSSNAAGLGPSTASLLPIFVVFAIGLALCVAAVVVVLRH